jgi:hypothetical protein
VAVVTGAGWLLRRIAGPVVLVAGPLVVGSTLVVVSSVVVGSTVVVGPTVVVGAVVLGSTVVVGAVVLGCTVVVGVVIVGAVMVGCVVVAPKVESAWLVVVLPPTVAGAPAVAGRAVVGGLPAASGALSGVVIGGAGEVVGSRGAVVVVDACAGAGLAGRVGSAPPGACRGGVGWWGTRLAEATTAARTAVVSPKANSSIRQGRRGLARCRGDGVGMCLVPVRLVLPTAGMPPERARLPAT